MAVIIASGLVALLGLFGSGVAIMRFSRAGWSPYGYWLLGLAALLPAWLIALLGLLGPTPIVGRPGIVWEVAFISSSAGALVGLLASDAALRRAAGSAGGGRPITAWLLGAGALAPAWAITLLGLAWGPG